MRSYLNLFLSLTFVFPGSLWGATPSAKPSAEERRLYLEQVTRASGQNSKAFLISGNGPAEIKSKIQENMAAEQSKGPNAFSHAAQTFLMLWTVSAIDAVYHKHKMQSITNSKVSDSALIIEVADHMLNNFELMSSMVGASATSAALKKPLEAYSKLIASNVTRPLLQKILIQGAGAAVSFLGWEAGAQLWKEAMYDLDENEIAVAKELRVWDIALIKSDRQQYKVFGKLMGNALKLMMFYNPERTMDWLNNTWRLRIGTGEFVTMFTAMVTAGVAAGTIAPGLGNLAGFLFGITVGTLAGVLTIFIPHRYKQPITDAIRRTRINDGKTSLNGSMRAIVRTSTAKNYPEDFRRKMLIEYFRGRMEVRNKIYTAYYEQIYDAYTRAQDAEMILALIESNAGVAVASAEMTDQFLTTGDVNDLAVQNADREALLHEYRQTLTENRERVNFYFDEMLDFQQREANKLGLLAFESKYGSTANSLAETELAKYFSVFQGNRLIYAGIDFSKAAECGLADLDENALLEYKVAGEVLLNLFYLTTFKECHLNGTGGCSKPKLKGTGGGSGW